MLKQRNAFTLIEMLISMLILAILIGLSTHLYPYLFSEQALLASTDRLYHFLALAQSQSLKYNRKIYVHFCHHQHADIWRMAQSDQTACDCFSANSCLIDGVRYNQPLSDGRLVFLDASDITFTGQQASYNTMRFSVNSGSITLKDSKGQSLKVIQSSLRLRICAPDSAFAGYPQC